MGDRAPFRKHHNFHKKKQWVQSKDAIYCDLKEINMVSFLTTQFESHPKIV